MARIYTDNEEAQGCAWASQAAVRFQFPSQASLRGIVQTHRPLASRVALLLRALREIKKFAKNWHSEKARGTPGLPGWRVF